MLLFIGLFCRGKSAMITFLVILILLVTLKVKPDNNENVVVDFLKKVCKIFGIVS